MSLTLQKTQNLEFPTQQQMEKDDLEIIENTRKKNIDVKFFKKNIKENNQLLQ